MDILLVEDESVTRECARMSLEASGFNVVAVPDGIKALEAMENAAFDIVLMDIKMPGMDGFEVARRMRHPSHPHAETPIIAVTGFHQAELPDLAPLGFQRPHPKTFRHRGAREGCARLRVLNAPPSASPACHATIRMPAPHHPTTAAGCFFSPHP